MSHPKSKLHEIAQNSKALKTARSNPIQRESVPKPNMSFLRNLVSKDKSGKR
jgi:hypothetical protein